MPTSIISTIRTLRGTRKIWRFPAAGDPGRGISLLFFCGGDDGAGFDVQVLTTAMRRATLLHGVASFFFKPCLSP